MIKYKVYIKAFFFILLIVGLFGFANHRNDMRKIVKSEIEFVDQEALFITKNEVNNLLIQSAGNVKNKTKETLFLKVLEEKVESNPMVEKAEVYLTIEGVLKTKVLQKKPIARVVVNASSYYLDDNGNKMELSKNYSARVPIVRGVLGDDALKNVYQFIKIVLKDDFMKQQVIGIDVKNNTFFDLKTRMGNQIIEFGSLDRAKNKIKKLKAFYQKMVKDNSLDKYRKVNLEYSKQVVCTK